MLDVFFTVDVELWCDGWDAIDAKFAGAFSRYIHGTTPRGSFGLPFQLELLRDHGLHGVFFVEPLFAARFGIDPLAEIIGLLREAGQDIELHLHPEWVDEAREPLLEGAATKRQHMRHYSLSEQSTLVAAGLRLLAQAGTRPPKAFRAGSFGLNRDTLSALARNGIHCDSSYNAVVMGRDSGVMPGTPVFQPVECNGVLEVPMTVFRDATGALRHAQLAACSQDELEALLWQALETEQRSFVILSHSAELLNSTRTRVDPIVLQRFRRMCAFFDRHRDQFTLRGFTGELPAVVERQPPPLQSGWWHTGKRMFEQAYRRRYG